MRPGVPGAWPYSYYGFGLVEIIPLFGCVFVKVGFLVLLAIDLVAVVANGLLAWFLFQWLFGLFGRSSIVVIAVLVCLCCCTWCCAVRYWALSAVALCQGTLLAGLAVGLGVAAFAFDGSSGLASVRSMVCMSLFVALCCCAVCSIVLGRVMLRSLRASLPVASYVAFGFALVYLVLHCSLAGLEHWLYGRSGCACSECLYGRTALVGRSALVRTGVGLCCALRTLYFEIRYLRFCLSDSAEIWTVDRT